MSEPKEEQSNSAVLLISNGPTRHDFADTYKIDYGPLGLTLTFGRVRTLGNPVADAHTVILLPAPVAQAFLAHMTDVAKRVEGESKVTAALKH